MTPYTLLAGASTVIVGGGIATGLGFALKPSSNAANQGVISSQDAIAPPTQTNYSHNYLVLSKQQKPTASNAALTCSLNTDCQLFNRQSRPISSFQQINNHNLYVLAIENNSLRETNLVEVTDSNSQKMWFFVKSMPANKGESIKPTMPSGLMPKSQLLAKAKSANGISKDQAAIRTKRYLNDLQDTYIQREELVHDSFLILKFPDPATDTRQLFSLNVDTLDNVKVDDFIFKSFADQKKEATEGSVGSLNIKLNLSGSNIETPLEIYLIKDQDNVKQAFDAVNSSNHHTTNLKWDEIARENLMITKMSEMKHGHYYKFVFEDVKAFEEKVKQKLNEIEVRQQFSDTVKHRMIRIKNYTTTKVKYCLKFSQSSGTANTCKQFSDN